jgi:hypothetical protein
MAGTGTNSAVVAHLPQGNFVGISQVRSHEGGASESKAVGVDTQEIHIPIAGALRVPNEDIGVTQAFPACS